MGERKSLFDQDSEGSRGNAGSPLKIAAVVLLLVGAVGVLAWGLGLFDGGPRRDTSDQAELSERFDEQAAEEEERQRRLSEPEINAGG